MEPNRLSIALAVVLSLLSFPAKERQDLAERKLSFANKSPAAIEITRMKNYKGPRWYEEFEYEIKNKSDKDIVYMELIILMPDYKIANNETVRISPTSSLTVALVRRINMGYGSRAPLSGAAFVRPQCE